MIHYVGGLRQVCNIKAQKKIHLTQFFSFCNKFMIAVWFFFTVFWFEMSSTLHGKLHTYFPLPYHGVKSKEGKKKVYSIRGVGKNVSKQLSQLLLPNWQQIMYMCLAFLHWRMIMCPVLNIWQNWFSFIIRIFFFCFIVAGHLQRPRSLFSDRSHSRSPRLNSSVKRRNPSFNVSAFGSPLLVCIVVLLLTLHCLL
jgi:hypothetical protein